MNYVKQALLLLLPMAVLLPACSGSGQTSSAILPQPPGSNDAFAGSAGSRSVVYHDAKNPAHQFNVAAVRVGVAGNSCCVLAIDASLNLIYVSRTADPAGSNTTLLNATSLSAVAAVSGFGGNRNVDPKTHYAWLPGLYAGNVEVYSGNTLSAVTTISLGACPTDSWIDPSHRRAWIVAQCGANNDPVWAINADSHAIIAGPIGTGGVMGSTVVNPDTGKFYVSNSVGNFEVNPTTFALRSTSFGTALVADSALNTVYATIRNGFNIVSGSTDTVKKTVNLSYTPGAGSMGINTILNHFYIATGQNSVEVREANTGNLLGTVTFPSGVSMLSVATDPSRGNLYAAGIAGGVDYVYRMPDNF
jgi:DNA-binding beta-propeller fold protein YncE